MILGCVEKIRWARGWGREGREGKGEAFKKGEDRWKGGRELCVFSE